MGEPRYYGAWPIAQRCEALLRVFNNPAPYAARLARRLSAAPALLLALRKVPNDAADLVGRESFARIRAAGGEARLGFNSS